uniref:malate synthase n=2 Tax=Chromera velia TaxID=505693 RepID=A0A2K8DQU0_9ALVE|nr:Malate synthase [Chromera velia]|mmetsp:Transcript_40861/g.80522  ORF Transcript_40861/g.80522 Transcript_40861/m.80522 type:complete len:547 (-) Transcript_40861:1386-3026(-)|eukprot:Cvel_11081.t1-p1 / transcript=Cvel_11081.t1 / gene=Cvel_11081 / organism=Chromera_velia_CCMP2878 / gene_product=Malate synthase, putative / transcript_product=Malate synthase, putative / location=Cvel_scaffold685:25531-29496(-) / protein_length=546 / sequence_SO=supercontig / SO=protein_coding / is_pseudo=false
MFPADVPSVHVIGRPTKNAVEILTKDALEFLASVHRHFNKRRKDLLVQRQEKQVLLDQGALPSPPPEYAQIRGAPWKVRETPADLQKRWVEITGPVDRKQVISALNSGASCFMADFEDASTPSWENMTNGQVNIRDATSGTISFRRPDGKEMRLRSEGVATLLIRTRGWHLDEKHVVVDGEPMSASMFDCAMYMWLNAKTQVAQGKGPRMYLPKLESAAEARLWADVISFCESYIGIPRGSSCVTILIETVGGALEMEEILFELREFIVGLNAGRWDYIFSIIKRYRATMPALPDRAQVTMTVPFMQAYTTKLVQMCHLHGAHAIGGMAANVPNRKDPKATEEILKKVVDDKSRELQDGVDGTWVAHPDLVPVVMRLFEQHLGGGQVHQKHKIPTARVSFSDILTFQVPGGRITEKGARVNISAALQYIACWISGQGAVAVNNLMEDAATAEISRAQLWQWLRKGVVLEDTGRVFDKRTFAHLHHEELSALRQKAAAGTLPGGRYLSQAAALLDHLVLSDSFREFLTTEAYVQLPGQWNEGTQAKL